MLFELTDKKAWQHAFYQYFGMMCNAGHGKLHCSHFYIKNLLSQYGFIKEFNNVSFN